MNTNTDLSRLNQSASSIADSLLRISTELKRIREIMEKSESQKKEGNQSG